MRFVFSLIIALLGASSCATAATEPITSLHVVSKTNTTCNGIAVTKNGTKFVGLPHMAGSESSFSLGIVGANATVKPFPGNKWNEYATHPDIDPNSTLVNVNAIHIFEDDTLWVVDAGSTPQKLVQFNTTTGDDIQIITFDDTILPSGSAMNDLRIHNGTLLFITDSGLGGIIVRNLHTGQTLRRLSKSPLLTNDDHQYVQRGRNGTLLTGANGTLPNPKSNQLEVDPDGVWFYFSTQAGPLRRIKVEDLWNTSLSDTDLDERIELYYVTPSLDGTAMDSLGNIYVSDLEDQSVIVIAADNSSTETLVQSDLLISPDAPFIDLDRTLYIPSPQLELLPGTNDGVNDLTAPFYVYSVSLPKTIGNITLGDQLG